jgi:ABC-type proline/glycine betaine transport system ATPase subunit
MEDHNSIHAPNIEIKNLTLMRQGKNVLQEVNLQVLPNQVVCLLGPSGSGKSSLLRCLNRLSEPPPDSVFYNQKDVTQVDVLELRRKMGFVFQKIALFPGSVAHNLAYGPSLNSEKLDSEEIQRLLSLVDLSLDFADRDSSQLSGGQAQRVALARCLATQPQALLLDEPTSALDPSATRKVEETVLKLRETLMLTVLWVTHDPDQACRVADWIYLLVDGKVADQGDPEHLLSEGSQHLTAAFAAGELEGST